jgi:D-psicose/D-tagatose/L-ribulose 3-epimerase
MPKADVRASIERRIACVTYGYRYLSLEAALRRIAANGFDAVELVGTRPHFLPEDFPRDELARVRDLLDELGLRVVAIAPFSAGSHWHYTAANAHTRASTIGHVNACIDVAQTLSCPVVQSITGAPVIQDVPRRVAWKWARDGLRECAEQAAANGVRIGLEGEGNTLIRTASDTLEMIADVDRPALGALFDIGHANMLSEDDPVAAAAALGPHLVHCHAHDNDGLTDSHSAIGSGTLDWTQVARALARTGYEGAITIEVGAPNPDGVAAQGKALLTNHLFDAASSQTPENSHD